MQLVVYHAAPKLMLLVNSILILAIVGIRHKLLLGTRLLISVIVV